MPVTKTAKRALRSSKRKETVNKKIVSQFEVAVRMAKKSKKEKDVLHAISLTDRAKKKNVIHRNKAARIKSSLSKLFSKKEIKERPPKAKKNSKKK